MEYIGSEICFIFSNNNHTYKTKDGIQFHFKSHDGWQVIFNEELLNELRSNYDKMEMI